MPRNVKCTDVTLLYYKQNNTFILFNRNKRSWHLY